MRYILVYARQRVFVVGGWNTVKFNILPCSFICHRLQGSIFSRGKDIYFYLFLFFDSPVQENDGEFTSYHLASDKKFLSENDEISPSSSLMLGLLAKKICGLYPKQEKSYQQIKTSQYFPRRTKVHNHELFHKQIYFRSRIHERTILVWFLSITLRVLKLRGCVSSKKDVRGCKSLK